MVSLTIFSTSILTLLLTSPAMIDFPVVTRVSHATLDFGSKAKKLSNIESLIWSASLSGWPSLTDSDVKNKTFKLL